MLFLSVVLKRHNDTSFSERGTDSGERRLDTKASSFKTTNDDYSCNIYMGASMCLCVCGCTRAQGCMMGRGCERSRSQQLLETASEQGGSGGGGVKQGRECFLHRSRKSQKPRGVERKGSGVEIQKDV